MMRVSSLQIRGEVSFVWLMDRAKCIFFFFKQFQLVFKKEQDLQMQAVPNGSLIFFFLRGGLGHN